MISVKKIRAYFYRFFLRKKIQNLKVEREIVNMQNAQTIGILYEATNPASNVIVNNFCKLLRQHNKEITMLGYVDDKNNETIFGELLINKKNLTWHLQPVHAEVDRFIEKRFDILINAFIGESLPLQYIAALSNAKFRVGQFIQNSTHCYELMINIDKKLELEYLLEQIAHFLNIINKSAD